MRFRPDGSIQSSATPTLQNIGDAPDYALYRCMVTSIIYTDSPSNITSKATNPRVLYDVVVLGGFASGQTMSNCRLASDLGGNDSYWERILRASTKDISKGRLSDGDGDIVFVQFIQGHSGYPVIIALDHGMNTTGITGATQAQGPRSLTQFNGVQEEINKDGELIIRVKGGVATAAKGKFAPSATPLATFKTDKTEKHTRTYKSGLAIAEDGANDKITETFKGGLSVVRDGTGDKVTFTTAGGAIIDVDGAGGKITLTKGSTIVEIDGASDKISLKGGLVDLGSSVSDFAVLFTQLLTAFNTHTHLGDGPSIPPAPTSPPLAPMLQTVGSLTVKVQP